MESLDLNERRLLVKEGNRNLSQREQCRLLGLHRSGLYYKPEGPSQEDQLLMRAIDEEYLEHPYYGKRRMMVAMQKQGFYVGVKKIRTTMQLMGLEAIYPKPHLSISNKEHKKYPYLLKDTSICHPDQVWAGDITYVPLARGFAYLFAIIDWHSRYVIEWELSNMLDTEFCLEALKRALKKTKPRIFNTDQGVQFTSEQFTQALETQGILISMDGKGRALDNIMVERLWRSVKYEDIYPKKYEQLPEMKKGLATYFAFYNKQRPHQGLKYQTPMEVYYGK